MNTPEIVHPVLFSLSEVVSGSGFFAGVAVIDGRGSMVPDVDGWWLYGVEPGVLAEDGDNPQEAHLKFAASFRTLLFDVVANTSSIEQFKEEVVRMFAQVNEPEAERWDAALTATRAGRVQLEDSYLQTLPKRKALPFRFTVEQLREAAASPKLNQPNRFAKAV